VFNKPKGLCQFLRETKDFVVSLTLLYEFADKYSHKIWLELIDNFKTIESYEIGANDVSDIVLNAIISTYNFYNKNNL
jgi:hypothetical protein